MLNPYLHLIKLMATLIILLSFLAVITIVPSFAQSNNSTPTDLSFNIPAKENYISYPIQMTLIATTSISSATTTPSSTLFKQPSLYVGGVNEP